jgi:hypothetical protein
MSIAIAHTDFEAWHPDYTCTRCGLPIWIRWDSTAALLHVAHMIPAGPSYQVAVAFRGLPYNGPEIIAHAVADVAHDGVPDDD